MREDLGPQYFEGANPRTAELWRNLEALAGHIQNHMKSLISFSLRINKFPPGGMAPEHSNEPRGAYIRTYTLGCLLRALPESCVDVELDTRGRDDEEYAICGTQPRTSEHLCPVLRNLLHRLRHLRLRLRTLCSELFFADNGRGNHNVTKASRLQSFAINLNSAPNSLGADVCGSRESKVNSRSPDVYGENPQGRLRKALLRAEDEGAFPLAKSVQLMNLLGSSGLQHSHFIQFDVKLRTSSILPFRLVWVTYGYCDDREYFARTKSDEELFGDFGSKEDLEDTLEGSAWSTIMGGHRWSTAFHRSGHRELAGFQKLRLETRAQYLERREDDLRTHDVLYRMFGESEHLHAETEPLE